MLSVLLWPGNEIYPPHLIPAAGESLLLLSRAEGRQTEQREMRCRAGTRSLLSFLVVMLETCVRNA